MRILPTICLLLLLSASSGCFKPKSATAELGTHDNPIIMAFVPSIEAEKVVDSGGTLCAALGEKTGLVYRPQMSTNYVGMVESMAVNKVHVAWLPPMAYVFAHQRNGDQAVLKVVRHGSPTYRGQIVVRADSPIKTLAELKGKRIAFTDQTSASGHLYPKSLLAGAGINVESEMEVVYSGSHDAALIALLKDSVDAACSFDDARGGLKEAAFPDIMETTRVLAVTEDIPADCVAVTDELDKDIVDKTVKGLLQLAGEEQGKLVLQQLYEVEGLVPATDADYAPVRAMAEQLDLDVEEQVTKGN